GASPGGRAGIRRARNRPGRHDSARVLRPPSRIPEELRENTLIVLSNRVAGSEFATPQRAGLGCGASLRSAPATQSRDLGSNGATELHAARSMPAASIKPLPV